MLSFYPSIHLSTYLSTYLSTPQGRLATWSRLVVITSALQLGYAWVAALDSDTVHQP